MTNTRSWYPTSTDRQQNAKPIVLTENKIFMSDNEKEIRVTKGIPMKIEVGVYYYMDEDGKPVFDEEEMQRELENNISELKKVWED